MTREEFNEILDKILPPTVGGMVRPTDPIPTDLDFCTEFRQLLQADMNLANHENAFLRQLFSNDKQCQIWIDELMDALVKQDFNLATQKIKGLMSAADKTKLDSIATAAEVNQNAISNIKVGAQTVAATAKTDTAELAAGNNIAISASGKKITIGVTGIANGAEINQNAFSAVQIGTAKINAGAKTDTLTIAAGKNISIIPDATNKKITIQIDSEVGLNLLKRNTAYVVGDIVYSQLLPSWAQFECITAGTTASTALNVTVTGIGQKITDGTVMWVLRHKGEMHNVGDIWMTKAAFNANGFMIHAITGLAMLDVHICDGTNGTVNMINRFAMGTNVAASIGTTGGANSLALTASQMPIHGHAATAWTDGQGAHAHSYLRPTSSGDTDRGAQSSLWSIDNNQTGWTDSQGIHAHNVGVSVQNAGGGQAFDNRPAYVAVAFVQKIY